MIVRVRPHPGGHDAYGDPVAAVSSRDEMPGAFTAPRTTTEIDDRGRSGVIVGLTLYAPPGIALEHTDQVEVDGVLYKIDGEPGTWTSPFTGWAPGVSAALERAG